MGKYQENLAESTHVGHLVTMCLGRPAENEMSKVVKKSNPNVLQFFYFVFHIVSNNVEDKSQSNKLENLFHNVSGILLTMSRTNLNEDASYLWSEL